MRTARTILGIWAAMACEGCTPPVEEDTADRVAIPADFALVFFVQSTNLEDQQDALTQTSLYLVEPDRTLRVALGSGVRQDLYPRPTATLQPTEMAELYGLIKTADLLSYSGERSPTPPVSYHVAITAGGRTHRYVTSPQASPATTRVLHLLATWRGVKRGTRYPNWLEPARRWACPLNPGRECTSSHPPPMIIRRRLVERTGPPEPGDPLKPRPFARSTP